MAGLKSKAIMTEVMQRNDTEGLSLNAAATSRTVSTFFKVIKEKVDNGEASQADAVKFLVDQLFLERE